MCLCVSASACRRLTWISISLACISPQLLLCWEYRLVWIRSQWRDKVELFRRHGQGATGIANVTLVLVASKWGEIITTGLKGTGGFKTRPLVLITQLFLSLEQTVLIVQMSCEKKTWWSNWKDESYFPLMPEQNICSGVHVGEANKAIKERNY